VEWENEERSVLKIHNPTAFDAETTVLIEKADAAGTPLAIGAVNKWPRVIIPAGECICFETRCDRSP
jgi:hypothetical protein